MALITRESVNIAKFSRVTESLNGAGCHPRVQTCMICEVLRSFIYFNLIMNLFLFTIFRGLLVCIVYGL